MENTMPKITNSACLEGEIANEITQFENKGEVFYEFKLDVSRLSGTVDTIPVTISKNLVNSRSIALKEGTMLNLRGEFRSRNAQENGASHLHLFFFAKDILPPTKEKCNNVYLHGFLCKPCIVWGRHANLAKSLPIGTRISVTGRMQSRKYTKQFENGEIENKVAYEVSINNMEIENMPYSADNQEEA